MPWSSAYPRRPSCSIATLASMTSSTSSGFWSVKNAPMEYRLESMSDAMKSSPPVAVPRFATRGRVSPGGARYLARMAARDEIVAYLDDLLEAPEFDDYGPNGLQVHGRDEVRLVVSGVSAHRELFARAAAEGADLVLCPHGIFWGGDPLVVGPQLKSRLSELFAADMS